MTENPPPTVPGTTSPPADPKAKTETPKAPEPERGDKVWLHLRTAGGEIVSTPATVAKRTKDKKRGLLLDLVPDRADLPRQVLEVEPAKTVQLPGEPHMRLVGWEMPPPELKASETKSTPIPQMGAAGAGGGSK